MPGNEGDGKLNCIFLENVWLYFTGGSNSLIHLPFFWPTQYVLGFSDNLWGSAPFYMLFRALGSDRMQAFQLWYHLAFIFNFTACYFVLREAGM